MEKLSVIIPNYNNSIYLSQCVHSVLQQTYPVHEIIIVDDASTDNSREIIRALEQGHKNVKGILLDINCGVSEARNCGFKNSTGDYVTFIDADDYYSNTEKLKGEMNLIVKAKKKGREVVAYSQTVHIDCKGTRLGRLRKNRLFFSQNRVCTDLVSGFRFNSIPRDYCLSRKMFEDVGGYSYPENFYEDLDLLIRLAMHYTFDYTGITGTAHRVTGKGLSSRGKCEHAEARKRIRDAYYQKLSASDKVLVRFKRGLLEIKSKIKGICGKNE